MSEAALRGVRSRYVRAATGVGGIRQTDGEDKKNHTHTHARAPIACFNEIRLFCFFFRTPRGRT